MAPASEPAVGERSARGKPDCQPLHPVYHGAIGEQPQLAVDNRMVVPAGVPIRLQTTAADVIHSFAVPSLWFKLDAVPGRLNEKMLFIDEPGVYYGQCSELCGVNHGFMPIVIEAVSQARFDEWVAEAQLAKESREQEVEQQLLTLLLVCLS